MARYSEYSGTRIGREMETAVQRINRYALQTAAALTEYPIGIDQTIAMLFPDEIIRRSAAAKGIVEPRRNVMEYGIVKNIQLNLDYEDDSAPAHCLPIIEGQMQMDQSRAVPLMAYINQVEAIYLQFEEVKAVLRWLNKNATLGAIRYYFPTVMKLCPETFRGMDLPSRHDTPEGVSDWLQPIRNAGNTIASAIMLPSHTEPRQRTVMWLTFQSREVSIGNGTTYKTDQLIFNA